MLLLSREDHRFPCILEYLDQSKDWPLKGEVQDNSFANYAHKLTKQEAEINWHDSAEQICLNVRAFNPWPVAFLKADEARIRIFEANLVEYQGTEQPGTILDKQKTGIVVKCSENAIRILKLQLPGSKAMDVQSFVNGGKAILEKGICLSNEAAS